MKKFLVSLAVTALGLTGGGLSFADGSMDSLGSTKAKEAPKAAALNYYDLRLSGYTDANGKIVWMKKRTKVNITINTEEGTVSGFTGCSGYTGNIEALTDTYRISNIDRTFTRCVNDPAVKKVDTRYLKILRGEVKIREVYKDLVITNVNTGAKLQFSLRNS